MNKLLFALLLAVPVVSAKVYIDERFDGSSFDHWTQSKAKSDYGKWGLATGSSYGDAKINQGLKTLEDARFYAISTGIKEPVENKGKDFVLGFTVKHDQGIDCGGGYIKVLPKMDAAQFNGDSEYWMMFGPDICGYNKKIHLIFNYNGKNLLWKKEPRCEDDKLTHAYVVVVKPDNTYEVRVDGSVRESGSLQDDWEFLPPKEIDDANDKKPSDWVDEAEMDDPADKKPDDWDSEPETIPDPNAKRPDDWDEEEDGAWEAPQVPNPKHKGQWKPKRIPNPAYKGQWKPKQVANPDYKPDNELYLSRKPLAHVGFDLWQVKSGTIFDNIVISDSLEEVEKVLDATWKATKDKEKEMSSAKDSAAKDSDEKKEEDKKDEEEDKEDL